jgi:hypothetical protein
MDMANERKPSQAQARTRPNRQRLEALLDEGLAETFPASDPVAISVDDGAPASLGHADRKTDGAAEDSDGKCARPARPRT